MTEIQQYVEDCGKKAREASFVISEIDAEQRFALLKFMASELRQHESVILAENAKDMSDAESANLSPAMLDRLRLDHERLEKMAVSIEQIAEQPEVLGKLEDRHVLSNGLISARMRIPLGVIAMIYEARPNVTSDAAALCLKSGNTVILKGGKEAFRTNTAVAEVLRGALRSRNLPEDAVILINTKDHAAVDALIR